MGKSMSSTGGENFREVEKVRGQKRKVRRNLRPVGRSRRGSKGGSLSQKRVGGRRRKENTMGIIFGEGGASRGPTGRGNSGERERKKQPEIRKEIIARTRVRKGKLVPT